MQTPQSFPAAQQATQTRNRALAYQLMRQALLEDPAYVPAWIGLSTLVDEPARQRECLERALSLDPRNAAAQERLEHLRLREMLASAPVLVRPAPPPAPRKLGEHLVEHGLLSQQQLLEALAEQRVRQRDGIRVPLGEIILEHGWLSADALADALTAQQECNGRSGGDLYMRLGDYLVVEGQITLAQLAQALAEQLRLRQQGVPILLGDILVRRGYLARATLEEILERQRVAFFSCFGD